MAAVRIIGPKPLVLSEGHCLILSLPCTTAKQDPDFGKHTVWVPNEQGSTTGLNWAQLLDVQGNMGPIENGC